MSWRGALRPLYLSFWSAPFYREVGREMSGSYLGYLFFVVTLGAIPGMVGGYSIISEFFGKELPAIIRQVPPIRISGGVASIDPPGPHVVVDPDDNAAVLILDTSGRTTSLDNTKATLLLTSDRVILRKDPRDMRVFMMSGLDNGVIDQPLLESWRNTAWNWMTLIYFPVAALLSFAFRLIQVLMFAVVAMLHSRRASSPLAYGDALRLTVFASTPAIAASAVRDAFGAASPLGTILDFVLVLVYLHFAVRANAGPRQGSSVSIEA